MLNYTTNMIAEMVVSLGYSPFIWDQDIFGTEYRLIQVNPYGVQIQIKDEVTIIVGIEPINYSNPGGLTIDIADPSFTEAILRAAIKRYI